jgi:glyoxylase-like metal-dependent hydrolase (beta-lactamase superfamily II)
MTELTIWRTPLREGCYMVGHRGPEALLHCNTYLRTFDAGGHKPAHWCIDPGSQIDYPHVRAHLLEHIGELKALRLFSINHQDPDVVGNLTFLTRENANLTGLVTQDVWRLVRHLDVKPRSLYFAEQSNRGLVKLPGGQDIIIVPTPFCHFRGAMAFYDPESRILFSGDLFGGLNAPGRVHLYGEEEDWQGIAQFHQIYMPTSSAVAQAIRLVRALNPPVEVIAPQHGFVLTGEFMHAVMDRLERLPVGMDLMQMELDDRFLPAYGTVVGNLVQAVAQQIGWLEVIARLRDLPEGNELREYIHLSGTEVRLERHGMRALPLLLEVLAHDLPAKVRAILKSGILAACSQHGVPLPIIGVGVEEAGGQEVP